MLPNLSHRRLIGGRLRLYTTTSSYFSSAAVAEKTPSSRRPHFMVEYLITSCGFSSSDASKASKHLFHLKSTEKPESFLGFMRSHGFDEAHIRKIILGYPRVLCINVENNLAPKFRSLQDLGFSGSDITHIILNCPVLLRFNFHRTVLPRIEFCLTILGSRDLLMRLVNHKNAWFLVYNIEKTALPNISLLRDCGISAQRTALVLRNPPRFIFQNPEKFRAAVERVERLGIPRSSGMFLLALRALHIVSKAKFEANLQLMRSFGWSEDEFLSAFRRAPFFSSVSGKMLSDKMNFLVKEVGCEPSEVARYPILLMFSLERRLVPRHHVMKFLKSRGLLVRENKVSSFMGISEKMFMEKYVIPYKENVPQLQEMYIADLAVKVA